VRNILKKKLQSLYMLQLIDLELDELKLRRGDLPETVRDLESKVEEYKKQHSELDQQLVEGKRQCDEMEAVSLDLQAGIDKHKAQFDVVKTNKEYDALTNEIEASQKRIEENEVNTEAIREAAVKIREEMAELEAQINEKNVELVDRHKELEEVLAQTKDEEDVLLDKRKIAVSEVSDEDMVMYNRIRGAKNGKAVVPVRNNSCSGCYNVVPPQLRLEIRKHNKLYICEQCGRILVSQEIADETKIG
jgi:predicted  nucleic acid-binding Zn-ribbon protein